MEHCFYNPRNTFDKYQQSGNLVNELEGDRGGAFPKVSNENTNLQCNHALLCLGNLTFGCAVFGGIFSCELEPRRSLPFLQFPSAS